MANPGGPQSLRTVQGPFRCPVILVVLLMAATDAVGQEAPASPLLRVEDGVMLWESGEEASLFGVNYYPAFSQSYRALNVMGKDHKAAIDEDIYHLARLDLDAFRVHLYDIEITDSLGNLLENDHLDLHEYTIHRMSERGIKTIITPTTYYNAAWPDGNVEPPPGFASYISKGEGPRVPEYRPVIKNYLGQLINHVNPYTGLTAAEDPNVIGLEIDNEPGHGSDVDHTRAFVNELAAHLRENGWDKPIFYNISHNFGVTDAFLDADIEGVTFQWYPAGLYEGRTNRANYFPYVNGYPVPWEGDERYRSKALMVYEFDPADAMHNYALPMMARSFREAGMQFAAQFAYTPMAIAHVNSDWRSHYLNMVYTPRKAVAMLIASEVFDRVDRRQQFDDYPADTTFGDFLVSHHRELSQLNAPDAFYHSNDTDAAPVDEAALERIAGVGTSPVVSYPGTGAYFLDRLQEGVWRLEVMPDAIHVRDPFEAPAFDKYVTHIEWHEYPMRISLSDLGEAFSIRGLNHGNDVRLTAGAGSFTVSPGAYLLTREGVDDSGWSADSPLRNFRIGEYHAVGTTTDGPVVRHRPFETAMAGRPLTISADVAGLDDDDVVLLQVSPYAGQGARVEMVEVSPHRFEAEIPGQSVTSGALRYWIVIDRGGDDDFITFPGRHPSAPWRWNFHQTEDHWRITVMEPGAPVELWDAADDHLDTFQGFGGFGGGGQSELVSTDLPDRLARSVSSTRPTAHRHVLGFGTYIRDRVAGISAPALDGYDELVVRAKSDFDNPAPLRVVLVDTDGDSFGATVPVNGSYEGHRIPLSTFEPERFMLLPRAFPSIMESWYATGVSGPVHPERIEQIQFYIDTSDVSDYDGAPYGFAVESAWLDGPGTAPASDP
jgi:hypothetical protein